jgi:diguanylate cyclase (GGDEF)-like protein
MNRSGLLGLVARPGATIAGGSLVAEAAALAASIVALGALDVATGTDVAFSVFYLLPVSLGARSGRRALALGTCAFAATTWVVADQVAGAEYSSWLVTAWNGTSRLVVFALVVTLLGSLRRALAHADDLSRTDSLTGACNQRHFVEMAEQERLRARRNGQPLSVVYIDLDDFKAVNDVSGHLAGDQLLRDVAGVLLQNVRLSDVVGRLGGDEFAVLLPETDTAGAEAVAGKLQAALRAVFATRSSVPVSASLGVASFSRAPDSFDALLSAADGLMYEVKAEGKDGMRTRVLV